ncbi:MAG: superoxide dismutase [Candidatus Latescibacteria bacterium]|nr:superoxide dismutase [Candidatus Latescibacterota bacterium]
MRVGFIAVLSAICLLVSNVSLWAHCEIPCGIYGDEQRLEALKENITTIEKSMRQIGELSGDSNNINQVVRWVDNKENHADQIREIVTQYFMTQRVKIPAADDAQAQKSYTKQLALLHQMMVYAMKCKQTTDLAYVEKLRGLLGEFRQVYGK